MSEGMGRVGFPHRFSDSPPLYTTAMLRETNEFKRRETPGEGRYTKKPWGHGFAVLSPSGRVLSVSNDEGQIDRTVAELNERRGKRR